jgi:hypothetical protein
VLLRRAAARRASAEQREGQDRETAHPVRIDVATIARHADTTAPEDGVGLAALLDLPSRLVPRDTAGNVAEDPTVEVHAGRAGMSGHGTSRSEPPLAGRCHCGNLELALETSLRPEDLASGQNGALLSP